MYTCVMTSYWSIIPTRMMDSFQSFQGTQIQVTTYIAPTASSRSIYIRNEKIQLDGGYKNEGWCGANRAIVDRQVGRVDFVV